MEIATLQVKMRSCWIRVDPNPITLYDKGNLDRDKQKRTPCENMETEMTYRENTAWQQRQRSMCPQAKESQGLYCQQSLQAKMEA